MGSSTKRKTKQLREALQSLPQERFQRLVSQIRLPKRVTADQLYPTFTQNMERLDERQMLMRLRIVANQLSQEAAQRAKYLKRCEGRSQVVAERNRQRKKRREPKLVLVTARDEKLRVRGPVI